MTDSIMHRLRKLLVFISATLCVAMAVIWIRSYLYVDDLVLTNRNLQIEQGQISFSTEVLRDETRQGFRYLQGRVPSPLPAATAAVYAESMPEERHAFMGFGISHLVSAGTPLPGWCKGNYVVGPWQCETIFVPLWAVTLIFAVLPIIWLYHAIRSFRWTHAGRCAKCGYDTHATPDLCPECGTAKK